MKHIKKFYELVDYGSNFLSNIDLNKIVPDELTIKEYGIHTFKRGNIMKNADMYQITFFNEKNEFGYSDCLEIDIYTVEDAIKNQIRLNVDITIGDFVVSEFSVEPPNNIHVIQHMTYGTKFCHDCPIFSMTDESIEKLVNFLNHIKGIKLNPHDLRFLNDRDDWNESTDKPK